MKEQLRLASPDLPKPFWPTDSDHEARELARQEAESQQAVSDMQAQGAREDLHALRAREQELQDKSAPAWGRSGIESMAATLQDAILGKHQEKLDKQRNAELASIRTLTESTEKYLEKIAEKEPTSAIDHSS
jgi:hypothetical protein